MSTGDLGLIVDTGAAGRPRVLLTSAQPHHNPKPSQHVNSGRLGCPHFDISMAQYFLGLSAWFDNMQEQAFVDIKAGQEKIVSPPRISASDWGFWRESFASAEFKKKWRKLWFGVEFCIFFPAIRADVSMETAYFPEPPRSVVALLNAAGMAKSGSR